MDIPDYPDYMITKDGRVFSKKSGGYKSMRPSDSGGYLHLRLFNDEGYKCFSIHRLVALTYIQNPHDYNTVDHIDRNRLNNNVENLRWVTQKMNMQNLSEYKNNKSNTSGYKNISYHKSKKYWKYEKKINGVKTKNILNLKLIVFVINIYSFLEARVKKPLIAIIRFMSSCSLYSITYIFLL